MMQAVFDTIKERVGKWVGVHFPRWMWWFLSALKKVGLALPVVGPLFECTMDAHLKSLKEFVPTIAFSTATFWLSAIFLWALKENAAVEPLDLLLKTVDSGELLIISLEIGRAHV